MFACSAFGPAGEFAASRHGALTRAQAADHGLTDKVIRRLIREGVVVEPVPYVLVAVGAPPTWRQQLYVATLASSCAGVGGGRAAAALLGVDGFDPGPIELLVSSHRRIDLPGLVVRRGPMQPLDITEVDHIRCTGVARTLCDLAATEPPERTRAAFEWAWRTGHSLEWIRRTADRLDLPGRSGPRRILELVADAERHERPTESPLELAVERVIADLPGIVRQYEVRSQAGRFVARVDFAIPELKIAIEAHSRRHHFGFDPPVLDADREAAMQAEGWIVRYVTDAQRRRPDRLRASLCALVTARSAAAAGASAGRLGRHVPPLAG